MMGRDMAYKTFTASDVAAWQVIAESARQAHHSAACQDDVQLYERSQRAFIAALTVAYPQWADGRDGHILYNLWLDSMESLQYYVDQIAAGRIAPSEWLFR